MGSKTALTSFCFGLWSLNNSRPLPQTSAEQLRTELITMIPFIIVTTENPDIRGVSSLWAQNTILRHNYTNCLFGKVWVWNIEIIMRLPQFTTRHTPMSHFQWSTVLSSDDWQPWHGFTGCQDSRVSWWQIYIFIRKIWMRHHIKSWISFEKESRKKLNSYVCGGSISWSKVFSTKLITRAKQRRWTDGYCKVWGYQTFCIFIILCLTKIQSWWRWGDET